MKYDSDLVREKCLLCAFYQVIAPTQLLLNCEMKELKSDCQFCK